MSLNKVLLIGYIGKEPETRTMNNGNQVALFSLATSESYKDKQGNKQTKTEWHRIVVYNSGLVGIIQKYCKKGSKLYVEGALATREYEDKKGNKNYITEIVLNGYNCNIQLLDNLSSKQSEDKQEEEFINEIEGDEIPF